MMHFERQLKFSFHYLLFTVIASVFVQCMAQNKMGTEFKNSPSSVQTGTYWYWIESNISREGVIKDLEAMKAAGINRAFIANIGGAGTGDPNASRKVEFMSKEWWDITHAALKKATELDIEIGIFNSPDWSQSGGPWIKPEETMRYLASSQKILKGPGKVSVQLPQPTEHFEDIKVLAFPNPTPKGTVLDMTNAVITVTPYTENVTNLVDGDNHTGMSFHGEGGASIDIRSKQPFTARSIVIRPTSVPICTDVELQARSNDGAYKTVSRFQINRLRDWKKVGFDPYADVAVTFEPTTSNEFRLIFSSTGKGERMFINFDKVGAMGKIYINGKYAGGVWTIPYKLDVTDFVKNGMNDEIKVEVVNTWVNRIVGDLNAPESERQVYCFINPHRPDSPLPASGLIGQVTFETIKY